MDPNQNQNLGSSNPSSPNTDPAWPPNPSQPLQQPPQASAPPPTPAAPVSPQLPPQSPVPPPVEPPHKNVLAILGLIFAFLFPIAGLILSILGLKKAKNYGGSGHNLSIAGIIISAIGLVIYLFVLPALVIITINSLKNKVDEANKNGTSSQSEVSSVQLGKLYADKAGGFSIKMPKGWQIEQNQGAAGFTAFPSDSAGDFTTTALVNADKRQGTKTLSGAVADTLKTIKDDHASKLLSQKAVKVNGLAAHEIIGQEELDGIFSTNYLGLIAKNNTVYSLVYRSLSEGFDKKLPAFKASAQTFSLK